MSLKDDMRRMKSEEWAAWVTEPGFRPAPDIPPVTHAAQDKLRIAQHLIYEVAAGFRDAGGPMEVLSDLELSQYHLKRACARLGA